MGRILIDQAGVGKVFVEEVVKSGLKNAQGIMLYLPTKQQVTVYLKRLMQEGRLHIPYEPELINEMKHGSDQFHFCSILTEA